MSDGVPRHSAHLSFVERVVNRRPIYRSRLGFHHPEILAFEPASQVVSEAVLGRVQVSLADVIVPGGEVEIFFHDVVIEAVVPSHGVCGDELFGIGRVAANHFQLVLLIAAPGIADESLPGQQQSGIAILRLDRYLVPGENGLAPVSRGPARV